MSDVTRFFVAQALKDALVFELFRLIKMDKPKWIKSACLILDSA